MFFYCSIRVSLSIGLPASGAIGLSALSRCHYSSEHACHRENVIVLFDDVKLLRKSDQCKNAE